MNELLIQSHIQVYQYDELNSEDQELIENAKRMTERSYAPYSKFHVGAALRLANGVIVGGCNQENAAYPVALCAERTALFSAGAQYPDQPVTSLAIAAQNADGFTADPVTPCGSCRQVMVETEQRFRQKIRILLYGTKCVYAVDGIGKLMPLMFSEF